MSGSTMRSSTRVPSCAMRRRLARPATPPRPPTPLSANASAATAGLVTCRAPGRCPWPSRRTGAGCRRSRTAPPRPAASSSSRDPLGEAAQPRHRGAPLLGRVGVGQPLEDRRLGLHRPAPEASRTRCSSAAWRTSPTVCRSSSAKIRLAVLGPTPGSASPRTAPGGLRPRAWSGAAISPVSISSATLSAIVSPTPGRLGQLALQRQPLHRLGRLAERLCRPPIGQHAIDDRALELQQVGHQVEAVGDFGVGEGFGHRCNYSAKWYWLCCRSCPTRVPRSSFPPTTSATTSRAWWRRWRRCGHETADRRATCWWWTTTRPTAPASSPTSWPREHDWVHVLHRPGKAGLGQAYIAGFRWALERDYSHILEMDCDLSHPPAAIPAPAGGRRGQRPGAGLALRARAAAWSAGRPHRRVISQGGSLYARGMAGRRVCTTSQAGSSASAGGCSRRSTSTASTARATCSRSS